MNIGNSFNLLGTTGFCWGTIIFSPNDRNPDYIGLHAEKKAVESDKGWLIYKITKVGGDSTRIDRAEGSFSNRDILFS